jgi:hypothetical protein
VLSCATPGPRTCIEANGSGASNSRNKIVEARLYIRTRKVQGKGFEKASFLSLCA